MSYDQKIQKYSLASRLTVIAALAFVLSLASSLVAAAIHRLMM